MFLLCKLQSVFFEPIFWCGLIGIIYTVLQNKKEGRKTKGAILLIILSCMIAWRLFIGKERLSSRYFGVIIIPWTIACIKGIEGIIKLLGPFGNYQSICHVIGRTTVQKKLCVFILIPIVACEIICLFKVDYYRANIVMAYDHLSEEINKKQFIYINDPKTNQENKRILYYAGRSRQNSIRLIDDSTIPYLCEVYPDFPYGIKNIFFINENSLSLDNQFFHELKSQLSNMGRLKISSRLFTSHARKKSSSIYQLITNDHFTNLDPAHKAGKKIRTYSPASINIVGAHYSIDDRGFTVSGEKIELFAKDHISISNSNRTDMNVLVKNIGSSSTLVYAGYILFDKNKTKLGSEFFPFNFYDGILSVIDTKTDAGIIFASSACSCSWIKGCTLTLDAKNDLSDVPNTHILKGKVLEVSPNDVDTDQITIKMDSPLQNPVSTDTQIRLSHPKFSYLYMNTELLLPGETRMLSSSIAKYDTFHQFSNKAFSTGIHYVKPMVFSYSVLNGETNTISISQWNIRY